MKFGGTMSKYGILATLLHFWANSVLLKNLQRWRADTIRPYERSEISAQLIQWHRLRRGGYQPPANVANF